MTNVLTPEVPLPPRWLHRWAVLTVCATFALLSLGSLVTTRRVGMADPVWPTAPWHLLFISWEEPRPGFLLEHSHRLAGYVVGCCAIVLAAGLWFRDDRRWLRGLGILTLSCIIVQGLLGGFRVKLHEILGSNLALIHGCFAPVVFALLVSLALLTAPSFSRELAATHDFANVFRLRRLALTVTGLVYLQIVLGAMMRHTYSTVAPQGHLLLAFAVVIASTWLIKEIRDKHASARPLLVSAWVLGALVTIQILMGIETWMVRFFRPSSPDYQIAIKTVHVLFGSLILAAALAIALQCNRRAGSVSDRRNAEREQLEETA